jgi:hypothetical protein
MSRDEVIAQEIKRVQELLSRYCEPNERPVVIMHVVSESQPLTDAEWEAIFSAEEWKPAHRKVFELIRAEGFYQVRSRAVANFWLSGNALINNHLEKRRLPFRIWSKDGVLRIKRI